MSKPALMQRLEEVLTQKGFFPEDSFFKDVDRDSIDEFCEDLGINILEKAYILGFDAKMIFHESFLKGIVLLELNRNDDNLEIWKNILKI